MPIKQALAKPRFGDEVLSSPEAASFLTREETAYVAGVTELPLQALPSDPAELKANACVKIKAVPPIMTAEVKGTHERNMITLLLSLPQRAKR